MSCINKLAAWVQKVSSSQPNLFALEFLPENLLDLVQREIGKNQKIYQLLSKELGSARLALSLPLDNLTKVCQNLNEHLQKSALPTSEAIAQLQLAQEKQAEERL